MRLKINGKSKGISMVQAELINCGCKSKMVYKPSSIAFLVGVNKLFFVH